MTAWNCHQVLHIIRSLFFDLHPPSLLSEDTPTDFVFVINSCYSGMALRSVSPIPRTIEVLDADNTALDNSPRTSLIQNGSFMVKLGDLIARREGKSFTIKFSELTTDVVAESSIKTLVHGLICGKRTPISFLSPSLSP
jgi:hypothetical protein